MQWNIPVQTSLILCAFNCLCACTFWRKLVATSPCRHCTWKTDKAYLITVRLAQILLHVCMSLGSRVTCKTSKATSLFKYSWFSSVWLMTRSISSCDSLHHHIPAVTFPIPKSPYHLESHFGQIVYSQINSFFLSKKNNW